MDDTSPEATQVRLTAIRRLAPADRLRLALDYAGRRLRVATVEDLIVAKLEWARLGGSARQIEDVAALLAPHAGELDRGYLDHWIADLALEVQWQQAQAAAPGE